MTDRAKIDLHLLRADVGGFFQAGGRFEFSPAHTVDRGVGHCAEFVEHTNRLLFVPEGCDEDDDGCTVLSDDVEPHVGESLARMLNAVPPLVEVVISATAAIPMAFASNRATLDLSDALSAFEPFVIPRVVNESAAIRWLGEAIGYGRLMQLAEQIWNAKQPGAAHSTGPCVAFLVPCPCPESGRDANGHCEWCCGAGRVTERVLRAIQADVERADARAALASVEHPFQGDEADCGLCGEGRRHYLHGANPYELEGH